MVHIIFKTPVITHQIKMNAKSVAILLLALFANFRSFESSEIITEMSDSPCFDSFSSTQSLSNSLSSASSSKRKYDLVKDISDLRRESRSDADNEFWDAIEAENYKAARKLKKKYIYNLDISDIETGDSLAEMLESDETPLKTLEFLYREFAQVFYYSPYVLIEDGPFYKASQRNIDYMTREHSDDENLMRSIREATEARRSELVEGNTSA